MERRLSTRFRIVMGFICFFVVFFFYKYFTIYKKWFKERSSFKVLTWSLNSQGMSGMCCTKKSAPRRLRHAGGHKTMLNLNELVVNKKILIHQEVILWRVSFISDT